MASDEDGAGAKVAPPQPASAAPTTAAGRPARRASVLIVEDDEALLVGRRDVRLAVAVEIPDGDVRQAVRRLQDDLGRKGSIALLKIHPHAEPTRVLDHDVEATVQVDVRHTNRPGNVERVVADRTDEVPLVLRAHDHL